MGNATATLSRKPSAEMIAIIAVGVSVLLAVLGQAVWLDGKIERVDVRLSERVERLDTKLSEEIKALDRKLSGEIKRVEGNLDGRISILQQGQAAIRERLAAVEGRVAEMPMLNRRQVES